MVVFYYIKCKKFFYSVWKTPIAEKNFQIHLHMIKIFLSLHQEHFMHHRPKKRDLRFSIYQESGYDYFSHDQIRICNEKFVSNLFFFLIEPSTSFACIFLQV